MPYHICHIDMPLFLNEKSIALPSATAAVYISATELSDPQLFLNVSIWKWLYSLFIGYQITFTDSTRQLPDRSLSLDTENIYSIK